QPNDGMPVPMHFLDAQPGQLVRDLSLDVAPEQLVNQVLRRQRMPNHPPAEFDRLEVLFLWPQFRGLMLEPPRRVHEPSMRRIHETECGVIGRAGKWLHDRCRRRSLVGKDRHARWPSRGGRFIRCWEVDPYEALPLDAGVGAATNLAKIHLLAVA